MSFILTKMSDLKKSITEKRLRFDDRYELEQRLGDGSFATVYSCSRLGTEKEKETLAVKVFNRKSKKGLRAEYRNESKCLQQVSANQYCIQMLDAFEGSHYCHIVMEKGGCSVQEAFLKSAKGTTLVTEQDLAHIFKCMLSGVQHLHECGVVHRDIKPANLLLAHGNSLSDRPLVKVCDLGLAAKLPARGGLKEVCGTAPYMAPEMLQKKQPYHTEVDLWSCGVTAYLMLMGCFPYTCSSGDPQQMKAAIREGKQRPGFKANKGFPQPSTAAIKFVESLLSREPLIRATSFRALGSDFIKSSMKPALSSQPSFGPTLSIAHDTTKVEPPAEVEGTPADDEDGVSTDESTHCGSSDDETRLAPRRSTCTASTLSSACN